MSRRSRFCPNFQPGYTEEKVNRFKVIRLTEDFSGLQCDEYTFPSDKGQMLAGYLYSSGESQRGIVVIAHGVGGVPQGVLDLEYAISFVEANDDIPDLPIVLFGHSWGSV